MKNINKTNGNETVRGEIIRAPRLPGTFVTINKDFINDKRLSLKAKGLMTQLLDKPDNWQVIVQEITNNCSDGVDSVRNALKELEKYGYYKKVPVRSERGTVHFWKSTLRENPDVESMEIESEPVKKTKEKKSLKKEGRCSICPLIKDNPKKDISEEVKTCAPEADAKETPKPQTENPHIEKPDRNNIDINKNKDNLELDITISKKNKNFSDGEVSIYRYQEPAEKPDVDMEYEYAKKIKATEAAPPPIDSIDTQPEIKIYTRDEIADKISLQELKNEHDSDQQEDIEALYDILCEVLTAEKPNSAYYRINRGNMAHNMVKGTFDSLEKKHIAYVVQCLTKNNNANKNNINISSKSYLMTSLYNSTRTISNFFERKYAQQQQRSDDFDMMKAPEGFNSEHFFAKIRRNSMKMLED